MPSIWEIAFLFHEVSLDKAKASNWSKQADRKREREKSGDLGDAFVKGDFSSRI